MGCVASRDLHVCSSRVSSPLFRSMRMQTHGLLYKPTVLQYGYAVRDSVKLITDQPHSFYSEVH